MGSGDIGLIMARRMTLEGAHVKAVAELMPYSGGLKRNIVQCLEDYGIPLKLRHTVTQVKGKERMEAVVLSQVDERGNPIAGTEEEYVCDTLLLSVGLIPENELSRQAKVKLNPVTGGPITDESFQTSTEGIFACGNVLHVHDLVDFVSEEASLAGKHAAEYVKEKQKKQKTERKSWENCTLIGAGEKIRYTVPSFLDVQKMEEKVAIRFRVSDVLENRYVEVLADGELIKRKKVRILTPGEMGEAVVKREELIKYPDIAVLQIRIKEE